MCGIAGTVYAKKYLTGKEIKPEDLVNLIIKYRNQKIRSNHLLEKVWEYKSNINFLRLCRNTNEKIKIKELSKTLINLQKSKEKSLQNIDKNYSLKKYNTQLDEINDLKDCHWFLNDEVNKLIHQIDYLSNNKTKYLNNEAIIFYKKLQTIINSIDNRLELRGRDSFGLSIQLITNGKEKHIREIKKKYISIHKSLKKNKNIYNFTFKTCSPVGELGDNAKIIIDILRKCKPLINLIEQNQINFASIIAHTRWASVGEVNLDNTHPIILQEKKEDGNISAVILNGDIYNYENIIKVSAKKHKLKLNKKIETDCLAIPSSIIYEKGINNKKLADKCEEFEGSFAIAIQNALNPYSLFICKKGNQGLYLGFSEDGFMFASDVYGLVDSCSSFLPINNDIVLNINLKENISSKTKFISTFDINNKKKQLIKISNTRKTNITTRDIDKKNYKFFLEKEIFDTQDIVERTLGRYIQNSASPNYDFKNQFFFKQDEIPREIISKIVDQSISKIIITGMGTCYTAAIAISMYMRKILQHYQNNINIEPHVASEGSAFYLSKDMSDTLVIVIAQSGTTIDTNVYVQMAKDRGAASLAIANKREGDVTFIVDGTLYIGDGRDIEIAVPSTKTYTAHIILGYILTLYIATHFKTFIQSNFLISREIKKLNNLNTLVKKSLHILGNESIYEKLCLKTRNYNSWYLLQDRSYNSVCVSEIRIKYSENCYQSVPYLNLTNAVDYEIEKSFITLITNCSSNENIRQINKILYKKNFLVVISPNEIDRNNLINKSNFYQIKIPKTDDHFSIIPTIVAGQFLSMYLAINLDKRKEIFEDLANNINNSQKFIEKWSILKKQVNKGSYNQGFSQLDFTRLNLLFKSYLKSESKNKSSIQKELIKHLLHLTQNARRTIDTVKHQAKTITVGAIRSDTSNKKIVKEQNFFKSKYINEKANNNKILIELENIFAKIFADKKTLQINKNRKEILIHHSGIDESYAYYLVNLINQTITETDLGIFTRLAQPYDLNSQAIKKNKNIIHILITLNDGKHLKNLNNSNIIIFKFTSKIISILQSIKYKDLNIQLAVWIYLISAFISQKLKINYKNSTINYLFLRENIQKMKLNLKDTNYKRSNFEAMEIFLSKRNWKCVGSGINYNIAKYSAKKIIREVKKACAFDVLENHKHIDISAESSIIVFLSNIRRPGYQEDAFAEVEKMISHDNFPIIITDYDDDRYDNLTIKSKNLKNDTKLIKVPVIKIPRSDENNSFISSIIFINDFISLMKKRIKLNKNKYTAIKSTNIKL